MNNISNQCLMRFLLPVRMCWATNRTPQIIFKNTPMHQSQWILRLQILDAIVAVCSLLSDTFILNFFLADLWKIFIKIKLTWYSVLLFIRWTAPILIIVKFLFLFVRDIFLANLYLELRFLNVISCYKY